MLRSRAFKKDKSQMKSCRVAGFGKIQGIICCMQRLLCWRSLVSPEIFHQISRSEEFFMLLRTPGLKSFKIPSIENLVTEKISVSLNIFNFSSSSATQCDVLFYSSSRLNFPQVSSSWLFEFVSKDICSSLGGEKNRAEE